MVTKRRKPKEDKIRDLLDDYHSLRQGPNETIPQFSHRFLEIQHSLEKLIPKIHFTPENDDVELRHSFLIKLRPEISKHLFRRDTKFSTLQSVIDPASRFEQQFPPAVNNTVNYLDPFLKDKAMLAPKSRKSSGPVVTCQSCGKIGHLQKHCRTINSGSSQSRSGLGSAAKSKIDYCFYYDRFPNPRKCSSNQKICKFDRVPTPLFCL